MIEVHCSGNATDAVQIVAEPLQAAPVVAAGLIGPAVVVSPDVATARAGAVLRIAVYGPDWSRVEPVQNAARPVGYDCAATGWNER